MLTVSSVILLSLAIFEVIDAQSDDIVWTRPECREMMESCELLYGLPGPPGPMGSKGVTGQPGTRGPRGEKGFPGEPGDPPKGGGGYPIKGEKGGRGEPGPKGSKGFKGNAGDPGSLGETGSLGPPGLQGDLGQKGTTGLQGEDGDPGVNKLNWKQCLFKPDINTPRGELAHCTFQKERIDTSLHVTYQGDTLLGLCEGCCKAWYFTFDNLTCTDPGSINAVFSALQLARNSGKNTLPDYMHGTISGYCSSIPRGSVRVGLSMDDCPGYPGDQRNISSVIQPNSRIIIQEVPAPQV